MHSTRTQIVAMNNFFNKALLWLFLQPKGLYKKLNVNTSHLRAILIIKLVIDDRTATGINRVRAQTRSEDPSTATMFTMLISLVMGVVLLGVFMLSDDVTRMTFYFASLGFMLAMFMITDFSHILLDTKDNYIILPKPVSASTFLIGRLLHIVIHLLKILIPMALPGFIALWISRGFLGALVFVPVLVLLTVLTFAIVNVLYLLILKLFSVRKINAIIASVQIGFAIILYGSFQILPRMLDMTEIENIHLGDYALMWLFPAYWLACAWKFIYSLNLEPTLIYGTVLSVVVPLLSAWLMIKYLAPSFTEKLSMMSGGGIEQEVNKTVVNSKRSSSGGMLRIFSKLMTSGEVERQSFLFVGRMVSRNRDFKLKVYPMVGYMIVLFALLVVNKWGEVDLYNLDIESSNLKTSFLFTIYLSSMICVSALLQLPYCEQFKAVWIFYSAPLERPGDIFSGALKACIYRFLLPFTLLISGVSLVIFGIEILPNLVLGFGSVFLIIVLYAWILFVRLPFSIPLKKASEEKTTYQNFFIIIVLPIFAIPQYFLFEYSLAVWIISGVILSGALFGLKYMRRIRWSYLKEG